MQHISPSGNNLAWSPQVEINTLRPEIEHAMMDVLNRGKKLFRIHELG